MFGIEVKATTNGVFEARCITIACYSLVIYDHILTLDQEIKYFWSTRRSPSHVLFFLLRYLTLSIIVMDMTTIFLSESRNAVCSGLYRTSHVLSVVVVISVQVALTLWIWELFLQRRFIRWLAVASFALTLITMMALIIKLSFDIHLINVELPGANGCVFSLNDDEFWMAYVPIIFIHTVLYVLLVYRVISTSKQYVKEENLVSLVIIVVALYAAIESALTNVPAMFVLVSYPSLIIAVSVVSTIRLMLSTKPLPIVGFLKPPNVDMVIGRVGPGAQGVDDSDELELQQRNFDHPETPDSSTGLF